MSSATDSRIDRIRNHIAGGGGSKQNASSYPTPDKEELLVSFSKKQGAQELRLYLHESGGIHYLVLAQFSISGKDSILLRWVAIAPSEINAVASALMDGYEMVYLSNRGETSTVKIPHQLCALLRKNGTRELRITIEEFEGHQFLKLAVFQDEDDRWKPGKEWGTVSFHDLDDLLPALNSAREQFEALATEK